jgi:hypothetical protein
MLHPCATAVTPRVLGMQGPPGGGMPGMMGMDPQQMQQMMGSPIVQNLLDNPEFLRSMMQSNPALRQVLMRQQPSQPRSSGLRRCMRRLPPDRR